MQDQSTLWSKNLLKIAPCYSSIVSTISSVPIPTVADRALMDQTISITRERFIKWIVFFGIYKIHWPLKHCCHVCLMCYKHRRPSGPDTVHVFINTDNIGRRIYFFVLRCPINTIFSSQFLPCFQAYHLFVYSRGTSYSIFLSDCSQLQVSLSRLLHVVMLMIVCHHSAH